MKNIRNPLVLVAGLLIIVISLAVVYRHFSSRETGPDTETEPQSVSQNDTDQPTVSDPIPSTIYAGTDELTVSEVMTGLDIPWDIAFTPDGVMLVNERAGKLTARLADGAFQAVEADFSDLSVRGELGLMGMVVDPRFVANRRFYTCQGDGGTGQIKVVAWRISDDYTRADRVDDPLVGGIPSASIHNGCRLRFGAEGYLWISTGDAARGASPQDLNSLGGKVLRVDAATGRAAPGNPFSGSENAELVYTFGHRNPQGLAWHSGTGRMWAVEHGPDVDDEINLLIRGGNYGWDPASASSSYYQQVPMTDAVKYPDAIEASWLSGDPTLAVSGAIFLTGERWGGKEGWLAVATLKDSRLYLFQFDEAGNLEDSFTVPELDNTYGRLRTPMVGPDGALYISTSNGGGNDLVLRVAPSL
ncbi:MAG: PQQ-dependent sugar dehydrogenase [Gammaproteobacteria bacterium]|nr:PQQ-dependent sugar dehydrogenase [Gammaproteobacteria bacterium]MYB75545.1 PQQ-dependent sugar dehydrogenase [Chloroflexota bacterium]